MIEMEPHIVGKPVKWCEPDEDTIISEAKFVTSPMEPTVGIEQVYRHGRIKQLVESPDGRSIIVETDDGEEKEFSEREAKKYFDIDISDRFFEPTMTHTRPGNDISPSTFATSGSSVKTEYAVDTDKLKDDVFDDDEDDDGWTWGDIWRNLKAEFFG